VKPATLAEIAGAVGGEILQSGSLGIFKTVSTDSRQIQKGDLFVALVGERFNAHDFTGEAVRRGAAGVLVSQRVDVPPDVAVILVKNTLTALQMLASYNRDRCRVVVVAVTGSTGKTTTKDMIASVLAVRFKTVKTRGNLNNEIGLPLTLLELEDNSQVAVVEMAMRGPGEIDALCRLARPQAAVITNIGETHLELLGSVSNIAAAKGELLDHVPEDGFALLNAESPYIRREAARCRGRVIFFGEGPQADIRARNVVAGAAGTSFEAVWGNKAQEFFLPVPGRHYAVNALAAVGVGLEMGMEPEEIAAGLAGLELTGMRTEILDAGGIKIINDAYNASPASVKAALSVLCDVAGGRRKVAVLGSMLELGARSPAGHYEVGEEAAARGVDLLVTVGDLAKGIASGAVAAGLASDRVFCCADCAAAAQLLKELLLVGDVVLVKGSRGVKMEQVVESLREFFN